MKALNPIKFIVLIAICLFTLAVAHRLSAQTVSWTSSHPDIVSVDENTGVIEMISEPSATTDVTITATTQQNGKILTSTKTVQVDSCTACFNYQAPSDTQTRTYCGVKLSNGQCWMDRNLGDSAVPASLSSGNKLWYSAANSSTACPSGWRLPAIEEWRAMTAIFGIITPDMTSSRNYTTAAAMYNTELKLASTGNSRWTRDPLGNYRITIGGVVSDVQWFPDTCKCTLDHYTSDNVANISIRCIKG